jgi:predicted nucleic acid-binding protein
VIENNVGLDTGVFERILSGDERVVHLVQRLTEQEHSAFVSCISLYELTKLRHRGVVDHEKADLLLDRIPEAFEVIWLDRPSLLHRAAGVSHGDNIPMADALILSSCLWKGCEVLYTTDADFTRYEGSDIDIVLFER